MGEKKYVVSIRPSLSERSLKKEFSEDEMRRYKIEDIVSEMLNTEWEDPADYRTAQEIKEEMRDRRLTSVAVRKGDVYNPAKFGDRVTPYIEHRTEIVEGEVIPRDIGTVEISVSKYNVAGR